MAWLANSGKGFVARAVASAAGVVGKELDLDRLNKQKRWSKSPQSQPLVPLALYLLNPNDSKSIESETSLRCCALGTEQSDVEL